MAGLSHQQRAAALRYRDTLLRDLDKIYAQRRQLNEQVLQVLLSGAEDPDLITKPSGGLFGLITNFWRVRALGCVRGGSLGCRAWLAVLAHAMRSLCAVGGGVP